jgi:hypothetical protein
VGYKLYREVRDFAPAKWTASMRLVALMIADAAKEESRIAIIARPLLRARTGLRENGLRDALYHLAKDGYEFRIPRGKDKRGQPVYAARGYETDYQVPDMVSAGMASITAAGDGVPVEKPP